MEVGQTTSFKELLYEGYILYQRFDEYDIWGNEQVGQWLYVDHEYNIQRVIPMEGNDQG